MSGPAQMDHLLANERRCAVASRRPAGRCSGSSTEWRRERWAEVGRPKPATNVSSTIQRSSFHSQLILRHDVWACDHGREDAEEGRRPRRRQAAAAHAKQGAACSHRAAVKRTLFTPADHKGGAG